MFVKNFVRLHERDRVIVIGDMNSPIGLLCERTSGNGRLLGEHKELRLGILNETIAEGKVTWRKHGQQSEIGYALVNEKARKC